MKSTGTADSAGGISVGEHFPRNNLLQKGELV